MRSRIVVPEILDALPVDDPEAIASRRQLRCLNALMGNFRWIARTLKQALPDKGPIVEIGAGDGQLACLLAEKVPSLRRRYTALDLAPRPAKWPANLIWLEANLWSREGEEAIRSARVVIANLVLHHFTDAELLRLGTCFKSAALLIFNETARRSLHLWQGRTIAWLLNRVTRHDLPVSVRAGFREHELPALLGLSAERWRWQTHATFLGAYRCVGGSPSRS
ncbi:MAG: methyltransferase domain-containing protein [Verrucomicrobiales bacterium]